MRFPKIAAVLAGLSFVAFSSASEIAIFQAGPENMSPSDYPVVMASLGRDSTSPAQTHWGAHVKNVWKVPGVHQALAANAPAGMKLVYDKVILRVYSGTLFDFKTRSPRELTEEEKMDVELNSEALIAMPILVEWSFGEDERPITDTGADWITDAADRFRMVSYEYRYPGEDYSKSWNWTEDIDRSSEVRSTVNFERGALEFDLTPWYQTDPAAIDQKGFATIPNSQVKYAWVGALPGWGAKEYVEIGVTPALEVHYHYQKR